MESTKTQSWCSEIVSECNTLAERFGLDDFHVGEMRDFVVKVARDQYKSGSKSGYWWAKRGSNKFMSTSPEAATA